MSSGAALTIMSREHSGKRAARTARYNEMIPGIIYGGNKEPKMICVDAKELNREHQSSNFYNKVFSVNIDGQEEMLIAKDVQLHPVTDVVRHVDFQRVDKNSAINVMIPLQFINEDKSPAIKRGGVLNVIMHSLEIVCPIESIPESLVVDLNGVEAHHSIVISTLKLPEGAKAAHPIRDNVLATIVVSSNSD